MRKDIISAIIVFVICAIALPFLLKSIKAALLIAGLLSLATLIICSAARDILNAVCSMRWPSTAGIVTTSQLRPITGNKFAADIEVSYRVDGAEHQCTRVQFGPQSMLRPDVEKLISEYPLGASTTVYYNQAHPSVSICKPGLTRSFFIYAAGLALCLCTGALIAIEAIRAKI